MLVLRYPSRALVGDWLRTACGLAIGLGTLLFLPWTTWILLIFGGLSLLFGVFGLRTLERQVQQIALSEQGLAARDWRQRLLPWGRVQELRLRFYGTRRQHRRLQDGGDPTGGFLELKLKAGDRRLVLDSALPGFALIAWRAAKASRECGRPFDPVTAGNLLTLGIDPDKDTPPPEMAHEWAEATAEA